MSVVVAGEALVDLTPRDGLLVPLLGGSPYNVAVGLGRLGVDTHYLGVLSRDGFGRQLAERLHDAGVDTKPTRRTDDPTTLAVVHLDAQGQASYGFYLDGTASAGMTDDDLPELPDAALLHVSLGAVTLATDPAGYALMTLLEREQGRRLLSLDPNVRPAVIEDLEAYRGLLERAVSRVDLLKASEEDLSLLAPGTEPLETATAWARSGPALVVVTRGSQGCVAVRADGPVAEAGAELVEVVDTVGAGDAFTAALLAWLDEREVSDRQELAGLDGDALADALRRAVGIAADTCTRPGADPPWADR